MVGLAAMAAPPQPPSATSPPGASILLLSPEQGPRPADTGKDLVGRTNELLVTMLDLGMVKYRVSALDRAAFDACFALPDAWNWDEDRKKGGRNGCIGMLLPRSENGAPVVAMIIENMTWRSAAQQMVCISPGAGVIERSHIHLRDIFHSNPSVRESGRTTAQRCIASAIEGAGKLSGQRKGPVPSDEPSSSLMLCAYSAEAGPPSATWVAAARRWTD